MQSAQTHPTKKQFGRLLGNDAKELDKQVTDHEINKVGSPFFMKLALLAIFWKHHFNRHKNDRHQKQVQQHPVEPEVPGRLIYCPSLNVKATHNNSDCANEQSDQRPMFSLTQQKT